MKNLQSWWKTGLVLAGVAVLSVGCKDTSNSQETASSNTNIAAEQTLSFEEFKAQAYEEKVNGELTGMWITNGDTPFSYKELVEHYNENYAGRSASQIAKNSRSIVHTSGGSDVVWDSTQKKSLTYCVSTAFGSNYNTVVADMAAATNAWEAETDIDFIHSSSQDSNCTKSNNNVLFDVNPVNVNGQYLARAFFPDEGRANRNVLVDNTSFDLSAPLTLKGILRHELGHTLGLRHEHTRPESGTCFEDNNWRSLTSYDAGSVMHYPQCNGSGDWSLTLTASDKVGIKALYDDDGNGGGGNGGGTETTTTQSDSVKRSKWKHYYVDAAGGTTVKASTTGSGDADLYTRVGAQPTTRNYDCRPYANGSTESCTTAVGSSNARVYTSVRGYSASNFTLNVTWTPQQ